MPCPVCGVNLAGPRDAKPSKKVKQWMEPREEELRAWSEQLIAVDLNNASAPNFRGRYNDYGGVEADGREVDINTAYEGTHSGMHEHCYQLLGNPDGTCLKLTGSSQMQRVITTLQNYQQYAEQYFDYQKFISVGKNLYLIIDPLSESADGRKNRERIEQLINEKGGPFGVKQKKVSPKKTSPTKKKSSPKNEEVSFSIPSTTVSASEERGPRHRATLWSRNHKGDSHRPAREAWT